MTLRLFLISLVAGVGLGLPAWPTIEGWAGGVQNWMNHQLAALDSRAGSGTKYVVIRDLLAEEMQRAHAARLASRSTPAVPRAEPRVQLASMPHEISLEEITRAAIARTGFVVDRAGLEDVVIAEPALAATAVPIPSPVVTVPAVAVVRLDELVDLTWSRLRPHGERFAADLAAGLRLAADRDRDARAFTLMEASNDLYFDGAFTLEARVEPAPLPAAVIAASEPKPEPIASSTPHAFAPLPGFEGLAPGFGVENDVPADDEAPPAPEALTRSTMSYTEALAAMEDLPDDVFAPIADAPAESVAAREAPTAPAATHDVNRAVRLTREAFSAWINVLTGPAVVTVSRPSPTVR